MANMPSAASLVSIRAQLADVIESARRFPQANAAACRVDLALYRETSELGYFESAERYCNRALTLDRQDPEVHVALGGLYRASGQLDLALSSLELATSLAPFSTAALRELALMLDKRGDFAAAEVQLLKALEIEPNGWRNYHELGGLHFRAGNYAQAANYYDLEVALLPNDSRALNNLGAGLLRVADRKRCQLRFSPQSARYHDHGGTMRRLCYVLTMCLLLLPLGASAKKSVILIHTNGNQCPTYTITETKNCAGDSQHQRDKSCRKRKQRVTFQYADRSNRMPFEIQMKPGNQDIFASGCTNERRTKQNCKILASAPNGTYEYNVVNDACTLDPRIIIY